MDETVQSGGGNGVVPERLKTPISERLVSHVAVMDPRHPLSGRRLAVLPGRPGRGRDDFIKPSSQAAAALTASPRLHSLKA
jgi:hypothetical protein